MGRLEGERHLLVCYVGHGGACWALPTSLSRDFAAIMFQTWSRGERTTDPEAQMAGTLLVVPQLGETDMEGPISIKEILAQLDGEFPMDEAVVEGDDRPMLNQQP